MKMVKGMRVRVKEIWDPEATDQAVRRKLQVGELGTVVEDEIVEENGSFVDWDFGGRCFMVPEEIEEIYKTGFSASENFAWNSARSQVWMAHLRAIEILWPFRTNPRVRAEIRDHIARGRALH